MKINLPPMTGEAIFAARKAAIALSEEKSRAIISANASSSENPAPIVTDHMRAQGNKGGLVETPGQSAVDRIREIGMSAYAEEVKAQKIEDMKNDLRKLILGEMGISEDELAKMAPKARANIEKIIEEEIQKRLAAISEQEGNDDDSKKKGLLSQSPDGMPSETLRGEVASRTSEFGPGIGVLLAMQEADSAKNEQQLQTNGKNENPGHNLKGDILKDIDLWQDRNSDDK